MRQLIFLSHVNGEPLAEEEILLVRGGMSTGRVGPQEKNGQCELPTKSEKCEKCDKCDKCDKCSICF